MTWLTSYSTIKFVRIDDARLGLLRLLLLLVILCYVIFIEMAKVGGYLESVPVEGVVEFSLREPTTNNCNPIEKGCTNNIQPLNELDYCEQADNVTRRNSNYTGRVYPCRIYEADSAKLVRETSIVVWTRASTYNQTLACDGLMNGGSMTCPETYDNGEEEHELFYIAETEAFTVLLEHAVTASQICEHHGDSHNKHNYACSAEASHYQGRLYSRNKAFCEEEFSKENSFSDLRGSGMQHTAPCYVGPKQTDTGADFFSIDVLLQAVGVSLDDCVDGSASNMACITYRDSGATLLVNIVWNDFYQFRGLVEPSYYYSPRLIGTHYKEILPFYHPYRTSRTLVQAHGIKIAVLVSGNFHQFQLLSFLITFSTAIGLLAIARKVTDVLMLYVLPDKGQYQQVKFEEAVHKDDLEEGIHDKGLSDQPGMNYGSSYNR